MDYNINILCMLSTKKSECSFCIKFVHTKWVISNLFEHCVSTREIGKDLRETSAQSSKLEVLNINNKREYYKKNIFLMYGQTRNL